MNFQLQTLSQGTEKEYILRTNGTPSFCTFITPIRISVSANKEDPNYTKIVSSDTKHIKMFNLLQSLHNSQYFIKNFSYYIENEYFKVVQQYYEKTLYSVPIEQLNYPAKVQIGLKIANIINFAHQQNVCFRSLRPQILSFQQKNSDIQVRIIWMDQAIKLKNGRTQTWDLISQISQFSAPQILGKKPHGKSADIWSLGAIFFHLLFGNSLYRIHYVNNKLCINYPDKTPAWLVRILSHLLHEDPMQRCDITTAISYFKSLCCCAQTSEKMIPKY